MAERVALWFVQGFSGVVTGLLVVSLLVAARFVWWVFRQKGREVK